MEKFKKQLESIYLPILKTQRVREKNLNYQCSKEREREKSFEQTRPCKWVEVEPLGSIRHRSQRCCGATLCRVHCVVVVLMFVKQWRRKWLSGFFCFEEKQRFFILTQLPCQTFFFFFLIMLMCKTLELKQEVKCQECA